MSKRKVNYGLSKIKDALPKEAFAIVGDPSDASTWKLPHHTRAIFRTPRRKLDVESTVNWAAIPSAVAALSLGGYRGVRVVATDGQIIDAARHLAGHYIKAGKSVPNALAVLI